MTTRIPTQAALQANSFLQAHQEYLFQDAHFFVEASAKADATEIAPNVFEFQDGSILHIQSGMATTRVYASRELFLSGTRR